MPDDAVMSSPTAEAPVSDATIESVIADSIADLEMDSTEAAESATEPAIAATERGQGEAKEVPVDPSPTAETKVAPDVAQDAAKALAAADEAFAKEHGVAAKDNRGRENRIPYTDVKRMVGTAERKLAEALVGKPLDKAKPVLDQVKAHFQGTVTSLLDANRKLDNVTKSEALIRDSPEVFIKILPKINPKYAELIGTQRADTPAPAANAEMPKPDGPDGKSYTSEGMEKRLAWERQQVEQSVMKRLDRDLKPVRDEREAREYAEAQKPRLMAIVGNARQSWPGFTDGEKAITAIIQAEPGLGLAGAYAKHMGTVLADLRSQLEAERTANKADREKMRAELLQEFKTAPSSTSTGAAKRVVQEESEETMEDVIAGAIKGLKR